MEWTNDVVLEFLDLYKNEPVIWSTKHSEHKNRNSLHDAWKRIEEEISIECSVTELKKKKESLMATFRHLLKKVKAISETSGDVFKPTWFAYEKMASFLDGVYKPKNIQYLEELGTVTDDEIESFGDSFGDISEEAEDFITNETKVFVDAITTNAEAGTSNGTAGKKFRESTNKMNRKRKDMDAAEGRMDEANKMLKTVVNNEKPNTSLCSLYGQLIAQKLETLDEVERVVVMNDIDNLLFRATMKHLGQQ